MGLSSRFIFSSIICSAFIGLSGCGSMSSVVYPVFPAEQTAPETTDFSLGYRYQAGEGVPRDYAKAISYYQRAAAKNDARSLNNLGVMALRGEGSSPSMTEARSYFLRAANYGSSAAHYNLGLIYDSGFYGHRDLLQAAREYRIASDMGHSDAQYRLSNLLETGAVPSADPNEWKRYFDMAVAHGNSQAIARIDGILRPSDIVRYLSTEHCPECSGPVDLKMADTALGNMQAMAATGDPTAQYNLAIMHMTGNGANRDVAEAVRLFTQSARQGYAPAQRQLAQVYLRGDMVGKSKVVAHSWLNLASKGTGSEADGARLEMERLEQSMTVSEIDEAQKLAAVNALKGR